MSDMESRAWRRVALRAQGALLRLAGALTRRLGVA